MVDARTLHGALGPKMLFANWIKHRIDQYGFDEGTDYSLSKKVKQSGRGGHNRKDYLITINMAKELSMLERSSTGREIRRYYIEMETADFLPVSGKRGSPV